MKKSRLKRKSRMKRGAAPRRKKPLTPKTKTQKVADLADRKDNPYSKYWLLWADELWSWIIKSRAGWRCERTGKKPFRTRNLQSHHLVSRNHYPTRHDTANGIALIAHKHKTDPDAPHGSMPWIFDQWLQDKHPQRWQFMRENNPLHRDNRQKGKPNWASRYNALYDCAVREGIEFIEIDTPRGRGEFPPKHPDPNP